MLQRITALLAEKRKQPAEKSLVSDEEVELDKYLSTNKTGWKWRPSSVLDSNTTFIYISAAAQEILVVPASSAPVECFFLLQVKLPQASEID